MLITFQKHVSNLPGNLFSPKNSAGRMFNLALRILGTALILIFIGTSSAKPASPQRVEVTAKRFAFEPAEITLKKGETVDLVLNSKDVAHGVRVKELNLDLHADKGKEAEATITPTVTGTFIGHCSIFCGSGHGKMTLTIHVVG